MSQRELVIGLWLFGWFALYSEAERRNKNVKRIQRSVKATMAAATDENRNAALAKYTELIGYVDAETVKPAKIVAATLSITGPVCGIDPEWARRLSRREGEGLARDAMRIARNFLDAINQTVEVSYGSA